MVGFRLCCQNVFRFKILKRPRFDILELRLIFRPWFSITFGAGPSSPGFFRGSYSSMNGSNWSMEPWSYPLASEIKYIFYLFDWFDKLNCSFDFDILCHFNSYHLYFFLLKIKSVWNRLFGFWIMPNFF